jgi:hypothetical protein
MKNIEGLRLQDLKLAFSKHLDEITDTKLTRQNKNEYWRMFWNNLKDKCTVVDLLSE